MKKGTVALIWFVYFIIFYICAEFINTVDFSLFGNIALLGGLLLYYFINNILQLQYIPKSNIIIWLLLTMLSLPLIIGLTEVGVISDAVAAHGVRSKGMGYLFFIPINIGFVICMGVENLIGRYLLHIRD